MKKVLGVVGMMLVAAACSVQSGSLKGKEFIFDETGSVEE